MIVGPELRGWLEDRTAHRDALLGNEAFLRAWNETCGQHLPFALAKARSRDAEIVAEVVRGHFEQESWVDDLVERLSAAACRNAFFDPPFRYLNSDIHSGLVIYEDELVSIAIGVTDVARLAAKKTARRARASIILSGQMEVFKFLKAGGARLAFWAAPTIEPNFTGDSAGRCTFAGRRKIENGETLVVDGRRQSFVIEHARSNLLVLQATVKPDRAPVSVEYDSRTHEYVGCSAADDSASRIQMITTLLRKLDHRAAVPAMVEFLDHPSFFLRWHVMRELLGIDLDAALPHLKRMAAKDPHPETRRAARAVLDRIEAPPGDRRAA